LPSLTQSVPTLILVNRFNRPATPHLLSSEPASYDAFFVPHSLSIFLRAVTSSWSSISSWCLRAASKFICITHRFLSPLMLVFYELVCAILWLLAQRLQESSSKLLLDCAAQVCFITSEGCRRADSLQQSAPGNHVNRRSACLVRFSRRSLLQMQWSAAASSLLYIIYVVLTSTFSAGSSCTTASFFLVLLCTSYLFRIWDL
jgi:hypothetical protein